MHPCICIYSVIYTYTKQTLQSWNMALGRFMLIFLLLQALGLGGSHIPTFWLLLYMYVSIYVFVYLLSVCLSIHPSIYVSMYLSQTCYIPVHIYIDVFIDLFTRAHIFLCVRVLVQIPPCPVHAKALGWLI